MPNDPKKYRTTAQMRPIIEKKKREAPPMPAQDIHGIVSPGLAALRAKPNKTQEDWDQLHTIQRRRSEDFDTRTVNIPARPGDQTNPTLAFRNNNPGNLGFDNQRGAVRGAAGFARFETPNLGYAALQKQLRMDKNRDFTIEEFVHKYAPDYQNDTQSYIQRLERMTGLSRETPLRYATDKDLADFISRLESSTTVNRNGRP